MSGSEVMMARIPMDVIQDSERESRDQEGGQQNEEGRLLGPLANE